MIEKATAGKETFKGKKVDTSGSGNGAQYAGAKGMEWGGWVATWRDAKGDTS